MQRAIVCTSSSSKQADAHASQTRAQLEQA